MPFSLEAVRAQEGDCLIIHFGAGQPQILLVDGGPKPVWKKFLLPRLLAIKEALSPDEPLPLPAVCLSHIDGDHVGGLVELFERLDEERTNPGAAQFAVGDLWHNGWKQITGDPDPSGTLAALRGHLRPEAEAVVASVGQGNQLDRLAVSCGIEINRAFKVAEPIVRGQKARVGSLELLAVAPDTKRIEELRKEWEKEPPKPEAAAALAAYLDDSVTNLSSLVLVVRQGERSMLLTGDARGDLIIEGLQAVGLLGAGTRSTVDFDIVKVPHHGSDKNVGTDFFRRVRGRHYVFSGDGKHHNPELGTLCMLTDARRGDEYEAWFTYEDGSHHLGEKLAGWRRMVEGHGVKVHFPAVGRDSVIVDLDGEIDH